MDNPDLQKYPLFVKAKCYQCFLEAGDVLFIPGKSQIVLDHVVFLSSFVCSFLFSGMVRSYQSVSALYVGASKDMGNTLSTSSSCTN